MTVLVDGGGGNRCGGSSVTDEAAMWLQQIQVQVLDLCKNVDELQTDDGHGDLHSIHSPAGARAREEHILRRAEERDELRDERREEAVDEGVDDRELAAARVRADRKAVHQRGEVAEDACHDDAHEVADSGVLDRAVAA